MRRVLSATAAIGALFVVSSPALAQDAVSEEEARCFVSGVCKIGAEKKFSLANISTESSARPAPAKSVAAIAAPVKRSGQSYVRRAPREAAPAAVGAARPSTLDMRLAFELGSAELTPGARQQADIFAKVLRENPGAASFAIEGHTDTVGTPQQNQELSRRRAESVVTYLVNQGVPAARLQASGYGFDRPRPGLRASDPRNRRVEIVRK
ncbi:OmpA family protein [Sphingomonas radiodurans]|uniref:OmpA family protein n=1 Tax=Sphingomonas radiodurans TaxID=2890321 RepID=UPI001E4EEBC6|nr:OmpA family protein [Sphingomonas radiodurans]WBH16458.1 OmpA family protein [Sphingomonas radiodurans]